MLNLTMAACYSQKYFTSTLCGLIKNTFLTANIKNIQLLMWQLYQSQYWHAVDYNFLLASDNGIFEEEKKDLKTVQYFSHYLVKHLC
jgi:hypothetical protein